LPTIVGQLMTDGLPGIATGLVTPITAFGAGATNTVTIGGAAGGAGAGKASFSDFIVSKMVDAFSVAFLKAAEVGTPIRKVQVDIFDSSSVPFATYVLETVFVTADTFNSSIGSVGETVGLTYGKLTTTITLGGTTFTSCFDRIANKVC
jgi:type VI protein secretion system component Hcp